MTPENASFGCAGTHSILGGHKTLASWGPDGMCTPQPDCLLGYLTKEDYHKDSRFFWELWLVRGFYTSFVR